MVKKILSACMSAMLMLTLVGCEKQNETKDFMEVLDDVSKLEQFEYKVTATASTKDAETGEETPAGISFGGKVNKADMTVMNVTVSGMNVADTGDTPEDAKPAEEKLYLTDIIVKNDVVYANIEPFVKAMTSLAGDTAMLPEGFENLGYVSVSKEDANQFATKMGEEVDANLDTEKSEAAVKEIAENTSEFVKKMYEQCKEMVVYADGTYTLTFDNNNYQVLFNALVASADDGSLKAYLESIQKSLSFINTEDNVTVDFSVDESIAEMKDFITNVNPEKVQEFSFVLAITVPTKEKNAYTISFTARAEEQGLKIDSAMDITPSTNVTIVAPSNVTTFTEFMNLVVPA